MLRFKHGRRDLKWLQNLEKQRNGYLDLVRMCMGGLNGFQVCIHLVLIIFLYYFWNV